MGTVMVLRTMEVVRSAVVSMMMTLDLDDLDDVHIFFLRIMRAAVMPVVMRALVVHLDNLHFAVVAMPAVEMRAVGAMEMLVVVLMLRLDVDVDLVFRRVGPLPMRPLSALRFGCSRMKMRALTVATRSRKVDLDDQGVCSSRFLLGRRCWRGFKLTRRARLGRRGWRCGGRASAGARARTRTRTRTGRRRARRRWGSRSSFIRPWATTHSSTWPRIRVTPGFDLFERTCHKLLAGLSRRWESSGRGCEGSQDSQLSSGG